MNDGHEDAYCRDAIARHARAHGRIFKWWSKRMSWRIAIEDRPRREDGPRPWWL